MEIDMIQWIKDHLDIRPFNADGKKDGNFNYIHQQHVLDLFFKIRNQNAVLTSAMNSDGESDAVYCAGCGFTHKPGKCPDGLNGRR